MDQSGFRPDRKQTMLTGLHMFVLPYAARWRSARRIDA